uniref:Uncharacterized protein n=1 Tax=Anguilla anguilla TaxID=7936 RepID=A0A0E9VQP6_ANGAN
MITFVKERSETGFIAGKWTCRLKEHSVYRVGEPEATKVNHRLLKL